jgi:hypothetical protein
VNYIKISDKVSNASINKQEETEVYGAINESTEEAESLGAGNNGLGLMVKPWSKTMAKRIIMAEVGSVSSSCY